MTPSNKIPILIVSGEHSGDLLGGDLMKSMHTQNPSIHFFGIGGENMEAQELENLANIDDLAVMGFVAAIFKYRKLKKLAAQIVSDVKMKNCKYVILIDYPGFNLALAEMLKEEISDIKIIFYVSPQIWAWRFKRIFRIKKLVDLMLLLFPFEKKIYDDHGIPNTFVGHPIIARMPETIKRGKEIILLPDSYKICLMPGSRRTEIRKLLDPILDAAKMLHEKLASENIVSEFILPGISQNEEGYILEKLDAFKKENPNIIIHYEFMNSAKSIESSDQVIVASGTATLEVAFFEKPMVIIYKANVISYMIGIKMLLLPYVGIVNILSGKFICKEFIQKNCTAENIFTESYKIYKDKEYYECMKSDLKKVKESLGNGKASEIAADSILKLISSSL